MVEKGLKTVSLNDIWIRVLYSLNRSIQRILVLLKKFQMKMKFNIPNSIAMIGILVGIFGVLGPIAWDYYKTKSEIQMRVIGPRTIISKPEKLDGLEISYNGEPVDDLSQTQFSVTNIGRTPILKKDIVSPISIIFSDSSDIIDATIDKMQPPDIGASLQFDKATGTVVLRLSLFNPGDRVDFSVLARKRDTEFTSTMRIAGVPPLTVIHDLSYDEPIKNRPWAVYPVGIFSFLLMILSSTVGLNQSCKERRVKSQVKAGTFSLPAYKTKDRWLSWVDAKFDFLTIKERISIRNLFIELPVGDCTSSLGRKKIMVGIRSSLEHSVSHLKMVVIVWAIAFAGGLFVFYNL